MSLTVFLSRNFRFGFLTRAHRMLLLPWTQPIYHPDGRKAILQHQLQWQGGKAPTSRSEQLATHAKARNIGGASEFPCTGPARPFSSRRLRVQESMAAAVDLPIIMILTDSRRPGCSKVRLHSVAHLKELGLHLAVSLWPRSEPELSSDLSNSEHRAIICQAHHLC